VANKCYKQKRRDVFVVATNANHALQIAGLDRSGFFHTYEDAGKTFAKPGKYGCAQDLALAESQMAAMVRDIIKADNIKDAAGSSK